MKAAKTKPRQAKHRKTTPHQPASHSQPATPASQRPHTKTDSQRRTLKQRPTTDRDALPLTENEENLIEYRKQQKTGERARRF